MYLSIWSKISSWVVEFFESVKYYDGKISPIKDKIINNTTSDKLR